MYQLIAWWSTGTAQMDMNKRTPGVKRVTHSAVMLLEPVPVITLGMGHNRSAKVRVFLTGLIQYSPTGFNA